MNREEKERADFLGKGVSKRLRRKLHKAGRYANRFLSIRALNDMKDDDHRFGKNRTDLIALAKIRTKDRINLLVNTNMKY